tara:strand:- start:147 stop:1856 length:1710 start_codon:yes stop_codon:yes gene_type:complete
MNKRVPLFLFCIMITSSLSGCFGSNDASPDEDEDKIQVLSDEWMVYSVANSDLLPECNTESIGMLYHVQADLEFQVCSDNGWSKIDLTGPPGLDGVDGITITLPWANITDVPLDIQDGDNNTIYSGFDFVLSNQSCLTGQVIMGITPDGNIVCVNDLDTTNPMDDFAASGQVCSSGEFVFEIDSIGKIICGIPTDTTLSEAQVDAFVANNNYATRDEIPDLTSIESVLQNMTMCNVNTFANCSGIVLANTDFTYVNLTGIDFSHSVMTDVSFSNSNLYFADFTGAILTNISFANTTMDHVNFDGAYITNGDFTDAEVNHASVVGTSLISPDFTRSGLENIDFSKTAYLTGKISQTSSTCSMYRSITYMNATYSGTLYGYYTSSRVAEIISFIDADLSGANFEGMSIWPSNFSGATIDNSNFDKTYDRFHRNTFYSVCDASGNLYIQNAGDDGAPYAISQTVRTMKAALEYYPHSNFSNVDAIRSSFLMSEVLQGSNIIDSDFEKSNLNYANLRGSNLTDSYLDYSWLHFADLDEAIIDSNSFFVNEWYRTTCPDGTNSENNGNSCVNNL